MMDVGGVVAPGEQVAGWGFKFVPSLVSCESVGVEIFKEFCSEYLLNEGVDFVTAWPDVLQENIVTILVLADGIGLVVDVDSTSECVSYDKRRTCKVVSPGLGVDTAFEVSVAR